VLAITSCTKTIQDKDLIGSWKVVDFKAHADSAKHDLVRIGRKHAMGTVHNLNVEKFINTQEIGDTNSRLTPWDIDIEKQELIISYSAKHKLYYRISNYQDTLMQWTKTENNKDYFTVTLERIK
jgi:hypothetical protein